MFQVQLVNSSLTFKERQVGFRCHVGGSSKSLEIFETSLLDTIVDTTHSFDDSILGIVRTDQWEFFQEMRGHSDQSIFWPSSEPIHGTSREQTREFERSLVGFKLFQ